MSAALLGSSIVCRTVPGPTTKLLAQLRRGAIQYCILALLRDDDRYGFELTRTLAAADGLVTSDGTVYPLLARLRRERLVETTWRESTEGPPRRYYHLTGVPTTSLRNPTHMDDIPSQDPATARQTGHKPVAALASSFPDAESCAERPGLRALLLRPGRSRLRASLHSGQFTRALGHRVYSVSRRWGGGSEPCEAKLRTPIAPFERFNVRASHPPIPTYNSATIPKTKRAQQIAKRRSTD
jgi:PadR family transcriptional regulator PadR